MIDIYLVTGASLATAGINTLLGMGTVFIALIVISFIISLLKPISDLFIHGFNKNKSVNPYRNNIVASESYIIELGYMNNANDIKDIKDNMNLYIDAIVNAITIKMQK